MTSTDTSPVCCLCEKALEHSDVVIIGTSPDDKPVSVHPRCLVPGKNEKIKDLKEIHIHTEPGKRISPAKTIVVQKRIREIRKAIAIANEKRRQEEKE